MISHASCTLFLVPLKGWMLMIDRNRGGAVRLVQATWLLV